MALGQALSGSGPAEIRNLAAPSREGSSHRAPGHAGASVDASEQASGAAQGRALPGRGPSLPVRHTRSARALTRSLALSCACCVLCHYSQYVCGTGAFRDRCVVYKGAGKLTSWRSQLYQSDWSSLSSADLHANIRLERAKVREQECSNPPQLKRLSASPADKELAKPVLQPSLAQGRPRMESLMS